MIGMSWVLQESSLMKQDTIMVYLVNVRIVSLITCIPRG